MVRLVQMVGCCVLAVGCSSVFPSARLARPACEPTPEALARVKYEESKRYPGLIEISCAGCSAVYAAAQHRWLEQHYPGQAWTQHYTADPFIGAAETDRPESCFVIPQPGKDDIHVCFSNTDWCDETRAAMGPRPPNNRLKQTARGRSAADARLRTRAAA